MCDVVDNELLITILPPGQALLFLARNKGAAIHKSKIGEAGKITATGCMCVHVDRVHCTINR